MAHINKKEMCRFSGDKYSNASMRRITPAAEPMRLKKYVLPI
jgi:hypothetical protein